MEFIFEILLQFLRELFIQAMFEVLFELGFHSLADTLKRPKNPILLSLGFVLWGATAGGISLLMFPTSPIASPLLRQVNLVATPIVAGVLMTAIGRMRSKRLQNLVRLDQFGYAFIFALAKSLVRFIWAA